MDRYCQRCLAKVEAIGCVAIGYLLFLSKVLADVGDIIGLYFMGGEITNCLFRF
jgi:hypothetical protein